MPSPLRIEPWRPHARIAPDFSFVVRSDALASVLARIVALGGIVLGAFVDDELRGYVTIVPASALVRERWQDLPDAFEVGSIEVASSARRRGIANALLAAIPDALPLERRILFARGFVGHWDLAGAELSAVAYRRMLLRILGRLGLERAETDDPEVTDSFVSFLAARVGEDVPPSSSAAFTARLFADLAAPDRAP